MYTKKRKEFFIYVKENVYRRILCVRIMCEKEILVCVSDKCM